MTAAFITIAQAVQLTGKSRRTIQRLVEALVKSQPDQVMKEKTDRGYIWKVNEQSVRQAYGVSKSPANGVTQVTLPPAPASEAAPQSKQYLEVALQGSRGIMAMHQEVKQGYEERLKDKDRQIDRLTQELELAKREPIAVSTLETEQSRRGLWGWLPGG